VDDLYTLIFYGVIGAVWFVLNFAKKGKKKAKAKAKKAAEGKGWESPMRTAAWARTDKSRNRWTIVITNANHHDKHPYFVKTIMDYAHWTYEETVRFLKQNAYVYIRNQPQDEADGLVSRLKDEGLQVRSVTKQGNVATIVLGKAARIVSAPPPVEQRKAPRVAIPLPPSARERAAEAPAAATQAEARRSEIHSPVDQAVCAWELPAHEGKSRSAFLPEIANMFQDHGSLVSAIVASEILNGPLSERTESIDG
jgi:hypothetical protein